jgi:hypothetical protein
MTDMSFKKYLKENKKTYSYILKLAVPKVTEDCVDCLIESLQKYELVKADKFSSTPPQAIPFDFPNLKNMPVHMAKITINYPASTEFLQHYLAQQLGISNSCIVVQNEQDPRIADVKSYLERQMPDFAAKYVSKLGKDDYQGEESSTDDLVKQVQNVLDAVKDCNVECTIATNSLIPDQKIDHSGLTKGYTDKPTETTGLSLFGKTIR